MVASLARSASIWRRQALVWRHLWRTSVLLNFGQPVMWLVAFGFALGSYITLGCPGSYLAFVAPGLLAITAMNIVTFDTMLDLGQAARVGRLRGRLDDPRQPA